MSTLYVTEPGAVVRLSSRTLVITKGKEKIAQMPLIRLENILVFGNVQITTQAMNALLDEGIDVSYLSAHGKLRGRLTSAQSKNVLLRVAQYERYLDDRFQTEMARTIIRAKIGNGRKMIKRYMKNHPETDLRKELEVIEHTLQKVDGQKTVSSLMGSEGIATAAYFRAYGKMFRHEFSFQVRTRRPPRDPVNALLSFGYTLITNEILALVTAHGLDPHIGFLHGVVYGRPSLALDLVEEFRHPVVDRFVLSLLNNNRLKKHHFEQRDQGAVYLNEQGRKLFFGYYDRLLKKNPAGEKAAVTLRDLFKRQVRSMAAAIKNNSLFNPYKFRL